MVRISDTQNSYPVITMTDESQYKYKNTYMAKAKKNHENKTGQNGKTYVVNTDNGFCYNLLEQ